MSAEKRVDVTVIVPVYNTEKLLRRCIDSLVSQTWKSIEILLIDDGSTDRSGEICDEYASVYTSVKAVHKKNGGVSSARNRGIDLARGAYLVFVDSDDFVHPRLIELYMLAAKEQAVLACGCTSSEEELRQLCTDHWEERLAVYNKQEFLRFMKDEYVNAPWNKCYEAQIVKGNGIRFDENKSPGEDFLFNLDYFKYAPEVYKVIPYPLYYYQEGREGSLANAFAPQLFKLQMEMFERLRSFMEEGRIWSTGNQGEYYQLYWNRLYLVIRIFLACKSDGAYPKQAEEALSEALGSPVWKKVWGGYVRCGQVALKDRIKRLHFVYLRWRYAVWHP